LAGGWMLAGSPGTWPPVACEIAAPVVPASVCSGAEPVAPWAGGGSGLWDRVSCCWEIDDCAARCSRSRRAVLDRGWRRSRRRIAPGIVTIGAAGPLAACSSLTVGFWLGGASWVGLLSVGRACASRRSGAAGASFAAGWLAGVIAGRAGGAGLQMVGSGGGMGQHALMNGTSG
jgi:hypothetical protein